MPLVREGARIGAIVLGEPRSGHSREQQIKLLETFADQAVIAIENVRLFKETEGGNRGATDLTATHATFFASSPTHRPSSARLDAIVRERREILRRQAGPSSSDSTATLLQLLMRHADERLGAPAAAPHPSRFPGGARSWIGNRSSLMTPARPGSRVPRHCRVANARTPPQCRGIPILSEGNPLGACILRAEVRPFTEAEIALLETFADQAVIAIENVRLFTELQEKNRALTEAHAQVTEALEQQTATSEILRVISGSPTDVEPVFRTILANANTLCDARFSVLLLWDGEALAARAHVNVSPRMAEPSGRRARDRTEALRSGSAY